MVEPSNAEANGSVDCATDLRVSRPKILNFEVRAPRIRRSRKESDQNKFRTIRVGESNEKFWLELVRGV